MTLFFKILKIIFIQLIILFTVIIVILSFPNPRHYFLSGVSKIPEFYFKNYLKTDLVNRNFNLVSYKLDNYYTLVSRIKLKKNRLVPGYIDTLNNAYNLTILDSEKLLFKELMNKSLSLDPENIYTVTNIIEINNISNPEENDKLNLYDKAIKINPSYKKIYVEGLKNALKNNNIEKINYFCKVYNDTILGESKDYNKNHILGKSLNKIALYINTNDLSEEQIYLNEGLVLNNNKIIFNILNLNNLDNFSIIFPNNYNLIYRFNKIEIISNNDQKNTYLNKDIEFLLLEGVFGDNNFLHNISNKTNRMDVFLKEKLNGSINQIILHFEVNKSRFINKDLCKGF